MKSEYKYRSSNQRQVVLEELRKVTSHPTADEVYDIVRKRVPRISLGTVYRNLEMLSETGQIMTLEYGADAKRYDGNPQNHYHVRCLACGKVADVHLPSIPELDRIDLSDATSYTVVGHRLEFLGYCHVCQDGAIE